MQALFGLFAHHDQGALIAKVGVFLVNRKFKYNLQEEELEVTLTIINRHFRLEPKTGFTRKVRLVNGVSSSFQGISQGKYVLSSFQRILYSW